MSWLVWAVLVVGLVVVFILWDLVFCNGKRCEQLIGRLDQFRRR